MAQTAKSVVLGTFEAGDRPTDQNFLNLFDSVLFINNVGQHSNGLNTANTSIEGNFIVGGNLSINGAGDLTLNGNLSIGNPNESITSPLHLYTTQNEPLIYASGSITDVIIHGIAGDSTSSIRLEDDLTYARFGTHTNKGFFEVHGVEIINYHTGSLSGNPITFITGSVGINSITPSANLEVVGINNIGNSNLANSYILAGTTAAGIGIDPDEIVSKGADLNIGTLDAQDIDFRTNSNVRMSILSNGNIGIGEIAPTHLLNISSSNNTTPFAIDIASDGGPKLSYEFMASGSSTANPYSLKFNLNDSGSFIGHGVSNKHLHLTTNDTNRISITGLLGKVGINQSNPTSQLHIVGPTDDSYPAVLVEGGGGVLAQDHLILRDLGTADDNLIKMSFQFTETGIKAGRIAVDSEGSSASGGGNMILSTFSDDSGTENSNQLYLDAGGNIGIGTDTPAQKLDIRGDIVIGTSPTMRIYDDNNIATVPDIQFSNSALLAAEENFHINIDSDGSGNSAKFSISKNSNTTSGTEIFSVTEAGTVTAAAFSGDGSGLTNVLATAVSSLIVPDHADGIVTALGTGAFSSSADVVIKRPGADSKPQMGIGTSNPQQPLHISTADGGILLGDNSGDGNFLHGRMNLAVSADAHVLIVADANDTAGVGASDIIFGYGSAVNTDSSPDFGYASAWSGNAPRVEIMRIDSSNDRVGIGTSTPDSKLDVVGDIAVRNAGDTTNVILFQNEDDINTTSDILFNANGGIGATNGLHFAVDTDGSGINGYHWYRGAQGNAGQKMMALLTGSSGLNLRFYPTGEGSNATNFQMIIGASGMVGSDGSGADPGEDGIRLKQSTVNNEGNNYSGTSDFFVLEKTDTNADRPDGGILVTMTGQDGVESVHSSFIESATGMRLGVGTVQPGYAFETVTSLTSNNTIAAFRKSDATPAYIRTDTTGTDTDASNGTHSGLLMGEDGSNKGFVGWNAAQSVIKLTYSTGPAAVTGINIDSSGHVGIGTQLPDNNLHVYENTSTDISLDSNNAQLILENDGAGDVGINYELSGTQRWSTYVDNTDNDIFKIKDNTNGHIPIQFAKNNGGTTISGDLDIINSGMINLFPSSGSAGSAPGMGIAMNIQENTEIRFTAENDNAFIRMNRTTSDAGWMQIGTRDNATEYISFTQRNGGVTDGSNTVMGEQGTFERMRIDASGISVFGDISVTGGISSTGGNLLTGVVTADQFGLNVDSDDSAFTDTASNGAPPRLLIKSSHQGTSPGDLCTETSSTNGDHGGGIRLEDNDTGNYWDQSFINDHLVFSHKGNASPTSIAHVMMYAETDTAEEMIAFTGQHPCRPVGNINDYQSKEGYIVSSNGSYNNGGFSTGVTPQSTGPSVNEALPLVELSNVEKDKKVFGVISKIEETNKTRRVTHGAFISILREEIKDSTNDERLWINSIGEGAVLVSNYNGNLENGDYITTSPITGIGMKQDDDLLHNYTVAKITQDCDFSSGYDITYNGQTYKYKLVGCTYHCG